MTEEYIEIRLPDETKVTPDRFYPSDDLQYWLEALERRDMQEMSGGDAEGRHSLRYRRETLPEFLDGSVPTVSLEVARDGAGGIGHREALRTLALRRWIAMLYPGVTRYASYTAGELKTLCRMGETEGVRQLAMQGIEATPWMLGVQDADVALLPLKCLLTTPWGEHRTPGNVVALLSGLWPLCQALRSRWLASSWVDVGVEIRGWLPWRSGDGERGWVVLRRVHELGEQYKDNRRRIDTGELMGQLLSLASTVPAVTEWVSALEAWNSNTHTHTTTQGDKDD